MRLPKICFVAQHIYPLLKNGEKSDSIGGAELQQYFLGKELLQRGHKVFFITENHGQKQREMIDGLEVISTFNVKEGIPGLRFIFPRLFRIYKALKIADADIYYVRSAGFILAVVAWFTKKTGKKVVYCGAHDSDFDENNVKVTNLRDKWLYLWGLKHCDHVIVQNKKQELLLGDLFKKNVKLIHNGMPSLKGSSSSAQTILWVSNIKEWKRPEIFIRLAKMFPNENFVMVGGMSKNADEYYYKIKDMASKDKNLEFKGYLNLEEVELEFSRAKIFINTSIQEGFPNTFLQSWRRGIPVVSYVDPDGVIKKENLGHVVSHEKTMVDGLKGWLMNDKNHSQRIRNIFKSEFDVTKKTDQYQDVFKHLSRENYD